MYTIVTIYMYVNDIFHAIVTIYVYISSHAIFTIYVYVSLHAIVTMHVHGSLHAIVQICQFPDRCHNMCQYVNICYYMSFVTIHIIVTI